MKRRSFLAALFVAPVLPAAATDRRMAVPVALENSGTLALSNADVGLVQAGILRSRDQRLAINLNNGTIEIYS
ncbi:hypothetical protein FA04_13785 [Ensifer adhaerens]|uniref:Uncharacterized protein n=1 Tax=Ensifer adhaerens TaxID=106592 RepID=A0ABY8HDV6_ENSAD|nr:hypothetical protein [Ensifer adhaerens]ANK73594.1 hypothetical protein FA04_13785 [Ensifer adhaerens]KDP73620.1 hypothetical protein FA04_10980 [Ensifer adhaerens]WFP89669.1 hypothetical protein P4B07_14005 [Ensifer adhaerens]